VLNGNFYIAKNTLKFSLINSYNRSSLQYGISDLSSPETPIGNLPRINLETGPNKIDLPLEDIKGLELGKMYLLRVMNTDGQALYLRFIYKGDE
jgi:hypothetical protein